VAKKKPPLLHPHRLPLLHPHRLLTLLHPHLLLMQPLHPPHLLLHLLAKRSNSFYQFTKKPPSGGFFVSVQPGSGRVNGYFSSSSSSLAIFWLAGLDSF
jgi:hypothetical protein